MYFMTSSLIHVSPLFPDQLLTCRPAFPLQSRLKSATKDCETSLSLEKLILNPLPHNFETILVYNALKTFFEKKKKNEKLPTIAFSSFSNVLTLNLFGKGF